MERSLIFKIVPPSPSIPTVLFLPLLPVLLLSLPTHFLLFLYLPFTLHPFPLAPILYSLSFVCRLFSPFAAPCSLLLLFFASFSPGPLFSFLSSCPPLASTFLRPLPPFFSSYHRRPFFLFPVSPFFRTPLTISPLSYNTKSNSTFLFPIIERSSRQTIPAVLKLKSTSEEVLFFAGWLIRLQKDRFLQPCIRPCAPAGCVFP